MDNNKTIVLDEEKIDMTEMSSNKTMLLLDEIPSSEPHHNKEYRASSLPDQVEKPFSQFFEINHANLLYGYAVPLISFANRIRASKNYDDHIYDMAIELINEYIQNLKSSQIDTEVLQSACFMLCMTIDEIALKSSWYSSSKWLTHGILDTFFQQSQKDGYFLGLVEHYLNEKNKNKDLIELFSICLSIGSPGNNTNQISLRSENLRVKLLSALKQYYPKETPHFSIHALPRLRDNKVAKKKTPLWLFCTICLLISGSIYFGFKTALFLSAEPILNRMERLYQATRNS
jgi:type VI secretion system protein ImpK